MKRLVLIGLFISAGCNLNTLPTLESVSNPQVIINVHLASAPHGNEVYSRIHVSRSGLCTEFRRNSVRQGKLEWDKVTDKSLLLTGAKPIVFDFYPEGRRGIAPDSVEQIFDGIQWEASSDASSGSRRIPGV